MCVAAARLQGREQQKEERTARLHRQSTQLAILHA
jgi:hypothetical protein